MNAASYFRLTPPATPTILGSIVSPRDVVAAA